MKFWHKLLAALRELWARLWDREEPSAADWVRREVLVGTLSRPEQLEIALNLGFYHIPAALVEDGDQVKLVAIYQSRRMFPQSPGIRYYGAVEGVELLPRYAIREIPSQKTTAYYRFRIPKWRRLRRTIAPKELGFVCFFTTPFLLARSREVPELWLRSEGEYRLYHSLRRLLASRRAQPGFDFQGCRVERLGGELLVSRNRELVGRYDAARFPTAPYALVEQMLTDMAEK